MTTMTSCSAASAAIAAHASRTRRPRSTSDSPPTGAQDGSACQPAQTSRGHVAQRGAVEVAVVELDPPVVDLDGTTERFRRLAGAPERAADDPGGGQRRGERGRLAAAELVEPWVEATTEQEAGRRSPRCGRAARRSARSTHPGTMSRPDATGSEELRAPALGSSRRNRRYSHQQTAAPISSSTTLKRTAAELGQLGGRPLDAQHRPPEGLGVGPRAVEDEVEQHPDRNSRASGVARPAVRERRSSRSPARPPRRPGRGGAGVRRSGARPAGGRCPGRRAGSRRRGCGRPTTR